MADLHEHDVVIVGGGGAGLRTALGVLQRDPDLSVALVSKVYPVRSHTVTAEGGTAAASKPNDSVDHHAYDTISGADWLADQDAVEAFVNEAPRELVQLEHWGCPWSREPDGSVSVRPFGGMKIERTWFAADKTGFHLLHTLFQNTLRYPNLTRYDEHYATKLLVDDGRCVGLTALELRTGQLKTLAARSVVMATGGAGCVFPFTTNGAVKTGDGMALAYRAGVPLKDMEFVQYHPTGLPDTGILITEAARGEGGILVNRDGRRYLQDYALGEPLDVHDPRHPQKRTMELGPRDRLSQAFHHEMQSGRTLHDERSGAQVVQLDIRHLGAKHVDEKLPFVRELARDYGGIDPVYEPIPVRPVVHYMMGGIDTDVRGATSLPGLFAAGECACVSINGANRLGSNSLTELLVFGARAGGAAADHAREASVDRDAVRSQGDDEVDRVERSYYNRPAGGERLSTLRNTLRNSMESGCGIYRDESSLRETCQQIASVRSRLEDLNLEDRSRAFNTQLMNALELESMVDVAEAVAHSGLARTESRGSHQRTDYPQRDNERFLKHSLMHKQPGDAPRYETKEVVITRWPVGERVYGK